MRFILWFGALSSFLVLLPNDTNSSEIGIYQITRGVFPVVAWGLSFWVKPQIQNSYKLTNNVPEIALFLFLAFAAISAIWSFDSISTLYKTIPLIFTFACVWRLQRYYSSITEVFSALVALCITLTTAAVIEMYILSPIIFDSFSPRFHSWIPYINENLISLPITVSALGIIFGYAPKWIFKYSLSAPILICLIFLIYLSGSRYSGFISLAFIFASLFFSINRDYRTSLFSRLTVQICAVLFSIMLLLPSAQTIMNTFAVESSTSTNISTSNSKSSNKEISIPENPKQSSIGPESLSRTTEKTVEIANRETDFSGIFTATGRTVIWGYALDKWRESPVLGFGYYSGHRWALAKSHPEIAKYSNLDNTWVETLLDLGLLGVLLLSTFCISSLIRIIQVKNKTDRVFGILLFVMILLFSIMSPSFQTPNSTLVVFAVLVSASRSLRKTKDFHL